MRAIELAVFMLCFALAMHARADSSPIDPSFGVSGRAATNFSGAVLMGALQGSTLQPDGKLVLAGGSSNGSGFVIARLNANGAADPTFHGTGQTDLSFGFDMSGDATAVAVQADGKIVAVGRYQVGQATFSGEHGVAVARFLPDGSMDTAFGTGGKVLTPMSEMLPVGAAVVIQADGKIAIAASGYYGSALIRYNAEGSLDTTFGGAGTGIVPLTALANQGSIDYPAAIAVQPDGKLVTAGLGRVTNGSVNTFGLARFTPNGVLDGGFNGSGIVFTAIGDGARANGLAIQTDGRIVAAGEAGVNGTTDFALARYNSDGSLDSTFASGGKLTTAIGTFSDTARAVAILEDGRIVLVGTGSGSSEFSTTITMTRYTANGTLDTTLGGTGVVSVPAAATAFVSGVLVAAQPDGRVIVGGNGTSQSGGVGMLFRYLDDGALDSTFGTNGAVLTTGGAGSVDTLYAITARADGTLLAAGSSDGKFALAAYSADGALAGTLLLPGNNAKARAVLEQPDGKIVIAGSNGGVPPDISPTGTFTVMRLSSGGVLDPTFNGNGRVETLVNGRGSAGTAAVLQPDGKIVVAGGSIESNGTAQYFALARYDTDGTLDAAFGSGGQVSTVAAVSGPEIGAAALSLQPDGKIVVAGTSFDGSRNSLTIVRYLADGALDPAFGAGGKTILPVPSLNSSARAIAIQDDGRIVVAGRAFDTSYPFFLVARLNANGSPDLGFGSGGIALTDVGGALLGLGGVSSIAVLADGRILASGGGAVGTGSFALARYLPNGSLDTTFGNAGVLQVPAPVYAYVAANALVLQGTNRAIVGGTIHVPYDLPGVSPDFELIRVFTQDTVPPDTALLATPGASSGPSVLFSFSGSDVGGSDVASFECALDSAQFAVSASPKAYSGLVVGSHTFQVRARDGAGNVDPTPASHSWDVLPQSQTITFAELPARVLSASPFPVSATGGDSGNPVVFSSLTPLTCTASGTNGATITLLAIGTCTIAADQAGSPSYFAAAQVTHSFDVFASGFTLTVTRAGSGSGRATSSPAGIDCPPACDWTFAASTVVTLTPAADSGSLFTGWSGDCSGAGQCSVAMDAAKSVTETFLDAAEAGKIPRLINISTRAQVQTGFDVMIGGFVIGGTASKTVVVRAIGPSLANYGIVGALADPQLQVVRDGVVIASNDNWQSAANASTLQASGFAPPHPLESAIHMTLQPGAYTAILSGTAGTTGVGLVEVYELDNPVVPLINISTRGKVLTGFDVMIGGFVISGSEPKTVVVRGVGPSLANYGISRPLSNPKLDLVNAASQTIIASNDDWGSADNVASLQASGFAPSDPKESAIYITLQPGAYTAILSGVDGGTGVGLIEVYAVGP